VKKVVDSSHADFNMLDQWFPTLDQQDLTRSTLYHLYQEALNWKQFVKEATTVYADRAVSAAPAAGGQTS
jgi:hypothetical protein